MHRIAFLVALLLAEPAAAASGCPVLFQPGIDLGRAARQCSAEGGLLVHQATRWLCLDRVRRASTIFAFETLPASPTTVGALYFYPQAFKGGDQTLSLNELLAALTTCLGSEPAVVLEEPGLNESGLVFRWVLKTGWSVSVRELNRNYETLQLTVTPTTQALSR